MFIYLFRGGEGSNLLLLWLIIVLYLPPVAAVRKQNLATHIFSRLPKYNFLITQTQLQLTILSQWSSWCITHCVLARQACRSREPHGGKKIFERSDLFVSKIRVQVLFFSVGGSKNIGYWQRRCVAECGVWQCFLKKKKNQWQQILRKMQFHSPFTFAETRSNFLLIVLWR